MGGLSDVIESKMLPVVSKYAPLLGSVLGSPFAGVGISLLAKAFGVNAQDIDGLASVLNDSPETAVKLKTLDYENAQMLARLGASEFQAAALDKQDARKYTNVYKDFLRHLAYIVTIGFFIVLVGMFFPLNISAEEKQLLSVLVGMLAGKWQTIIDFFYGSSSPNYRQGESQ